MKFGGVAPSKLPQLSRKVKDLPRIRRHSRERLNFMSEDFPSTRFRNATNIPLELCIAALTLLPFLVLTYFYSGLPERISIQFRTQVGVCFPCLPALPAVIDFLADAEFVNARI